MTTCSGQEVLVIFNSFIIVKQSCHVYMCYRYRLCLCIYDFCIRFWNCFERAIFFFHFINELVGWGDKNHVNLPIIHIVYAREL